MSLTTDIKAAELIPSSLPVIPSHLLCNDYLNGFCRKADNCNKSHTICANPTDGQGRPVLRYPTNYLSLEPRGSIRNTVVFDDEGPGELSSSGPRHDNDYVEIQHIKILPTTSEILTRRLPFMPKKDPFSPHHYPCGQDRLLDIHFRHLRYDNVESIIDCCYHASQQLASMRSVPPSSDYDNRMVTPKGFRYSLFQQINFEELIFAPKKALTVRVSFACPKALRGRRLGSTNHFEKGMLLALIGLDQNNLLSTTFMEVHMRQSTDAMRPRTGNDLRGQSFPPKTFLISVTDRPSFRYPVIC